MVDGIPQTNGGGVNPAHSKVLDDLKAKIDGNRNGLKGSEIINFVNFAKAEGVSDADIQVYMQKNGLAIASEKETHKADIEAFKDDQYSKTSRGTKNEILNQRQGYMNVALDAFKNAKTPEEKAQIMNLVQTMPRSASSVDSFDTKMQVWLNRLENVVGSERLMQFMGAFSQKADLQHDITQLQIQKTGLETQQTVLQTGQAVIGAVNEHTDEVGKNVVRQVGAKIDDAVTRINDHTDEQVVGLRHSLIGEYGEVDDKGNQITEVGGALGEATKDVKATVGNAAKDVKQHVTGEHNATRNHIDQTAHDTQVLQSARNEVTEIINECNLNDNDVRALSDETNYIMDSNKLNAEQKVQLLESMAQHINDVSYISDGDLSRIATARKLFEAGKTLPTKEVSMGDKTVKGWFIDYDEIE